MSTAILAAAQDVLGSIPTPFCLTRMGDAVLTVASHGCVHIHATTDAAAVKTAITSLVFVPARLVTAGVQAQRQRRVFQ